MGLDVTAVHLIWFFAFLGLAGGAATAILDLGESTVEAADARRALEAERLRTRLSDGWFCHDANAQLLYVDARNAGRTTLSAGNVTILVDGAVADGFTPEPDDAPASDLWSPDVRTLFLRAGHASEPDRVALFTSSGIAHYPEKRATCPILSSITLTPAAAGMQVGDEQDFVAQGYDQYGEPIEGLTFTWASGGAGTLATTGQASARLTAGTTAGTYTLTATLGLVQGSATVTVHPGAPATILVSPGVAGVTAGGTQAFTATAYDAHGNLNATAPLAWSTDAGSVDQDGLLTAQTTAATGRSVTATSGAASGSATVDVLADAPVSASVTPATATVGAGTTRLFTATLTDQHGNVNATAPVTWTTNAGTITSGGLLTAQTTTASGLSVTATSGAATASATVDVVAADPATVTVSPGVAGVPAGGTQAFTASVHDQYGNLNATAPVTWTTNAGTITGSGVLTAQTTAATGRLVTATSGAASGAATVDVLAGAPATVTVSPTPTTVTAGGTKTFTATARDAHGNLNATAPITWTTNAGTITSGGVLTASTTAANGLSVTATSGAASGSATVDVLPGPVDTITVSPSSATVPLNGTQAFTATMRDQYGNVNTTATLAWSATSGTITGSGLYTAPAVSGSATVTASANGKTGTAAVTVTREVHVDAMGTYKAGVASTSFRKGTDTVEVRVTVRDHEGVLVAGATVTVQYVDSNGAVAATRTATTSSTGVASVTYSLPNNAPQNGWVARVTGITGSGMTYNAATNVVTQVGFTVTP